MLLILFVILAILCWFGSGFNAKVGSANNLWNLFSLGWAFAGLAFLSTIVNVGL